MPKDIVEVRLNLTLDALHVGTAVEPHLFTILDQSDIRAVLQDWYNFTPTRRKDKKGWKTWTALARVPTEDFENYWKNYQDEPVQQTYTNPQNLWRIVALQFLKGCTNTGPAAPQECRHCTDAFVRAIQQLQQDEA
jgi:hypothetical protein